MNINDLLCCPQCGGKLKMISESMVDGRLWQGRLVCQPCDRDYPIVRGIARFVPAENYGESFGRQWKRFREELVDSQSGTTLSHDRFYDVTRWNAEDLKDQWVLDVGCGAGRFAEIALQAGAHVVAMDISSAVDACYENLIERFPDRLHVVQANIYELPFRPHSFDRVCCIGVVQHTPDPLKAIDAIARLPRAGGHLAMWIYERKWYLFLGIYAWKYSLRILTRRLGFRENYIFAFVLTSLFWPLWFPLMHMGELGRMLLFWMPIAAGPYIGKGYDMRRLFRCVVMDTLDMYSPTYDKPQNYSDVAAILRRRGFVNIERTCSGLGIRAIASAEVEK
jgi:SAM-dependent methyltransferase